MAGVLPTLATRAGPATPALLGMQGDARGWCWQALKECPHIVGPWERPAPLPPFLCSRSSPGKFATWKGVTLWGPLSPAFGPWSPLRTRNERTSSVPWPEARDNERAANVG